MKYSRYDKYADRDWVGEIAERVDATGDGCWVWTGQGDKLGYGRFQWHGRVFLAHRVVWETFVGPVPDGLVLDHLCRNPPCVNPDHLEPVTQQTNILRGTAPTAINAAKTVCKWGHPLTGENVIARPDGRECRTCQRANSRVSKMRRRLADQHPGVRWSVQRTEEVIEPGVYDDLVVIPLDQLHEFVAGMVENWGQV